MRQEQKTIKQKILRVLSISCIMTVVLSAYWWNGKRLTKMVQQNTSLYDATEELSVKEKIFIREFVKGMKDVYDVSASVKIYEDAMPKIKKTNALQIVISVTEQKVIIEAPPLLSRVLGGFDKKLVSSIEENYIAKGKWQEGLQVLLAELWTYLRETE